MTGHRSPARRDQGIVTLVVVASAFLVLLFVLVLLDAALRDGVQGRRDQDAKVAVAAARSGLDDYASHLNADPAYWTKGGTDPANPALTATGGRTVSAAGPARFRYQVLSTPQDVARTGVVRVRATGTSSPGAGRPAVSRSLTATLRSSSFLAYAYFSDIEVMDPVLTGSDPHCAAYAYGAVSRQGLSCPSIIWKAGDQVDGPVHSNDAFTIDSGVDFRDPRVETSWPAVAGAGAGARTWLGAASTLPGNRPVFAPGLSLPAGAEQLGAYASPGPDASASGPGCAYTGATRIVFDGSSMRVFSPATSDPATPDRCLTVADRGREQVKPIPPLVYVAPAGGTCTRGEVGYPVAGEAFTAGPADAAAWGRTTNYDCHRGTAYVQGHVHGQVTVAGADDVVVTGDLTLDDGGRADDVVGLVAGTFVWVHHPVDAAGNNLTATPAVRRVQAAILSLEHSFVVQNWSAGAGLGDLQLLGSIAQKMRGPVGATDPRTGDLSGYLKAYTYDRRFRSLQPPFFLRPGTNVWRVEDVTDG